MKLFVAGISYKTAPVEVREKLAVHPSLLPCNSCRVKLGAGLEEVVLLSTCNRVEVYGTQTPVNQLGTVTVPDATMLVISPWDPSVVALVDKAIRASDLGLNPTNDGKVVRVPIPAPTEERRKELVKHIHKVLENHRTAVRNIRRDVKEAIDKLEKDKKISQDEQKRALDELERVSHAETKKIEDLSASKEKEVMEIK